MRLENYYQYLIFISPLLLISTDSLDQIHTVQGSLKPMIMLQKLRMK